MNDVKWSQSKQLRKGCLTSESMGNLLKELSAVAGDRSNFTYEVKGNQGSMQKASFQCGFQ